MTIEPSVIWTNDPHSAIDQLMPSATYAPSSEGETFRELRSLLGTASHSEWIPPRALETALRMCPGPVSSNRDYVLVFPAERLLRTLEDIQRAAFPRSHTVADPVPLSADVARTIREVSGLGAERLGDLFPVARETFQRWTSGAGIPSTANLERLLLLRRLLLDIASRTNDVRGWLLTPIDERDDHKSPFALLKEGRVTEAWHSARLAGSPRFEKYRDGDGNVAHRALGNIAGRLEADLHEPDDFEE